PDAQKVIVKRWSFAGADVQRIPFEAITGYAIEPEGQDKKTRLTIQTNRGDVAASGGMLGARAAWDEVVAAMRAHMTADGAANGPSARD
ncbi:MAG: hypothetical protein KI785_10500, partial [Devosiaceae bacterium]|nr:hypothetical protein [Devosiaceae bacterium MH13]